VVTIPSNNNNNNNKNNNNLCQQDKEFYTQNFSFVRDLYNY